MDIHCCESRDLYMYMYMYMYTALATAATKS